MEQRRDRQDLPTEEEGHSRDDQDDDERNVARWDAAGADADSDDDGKVGVVRGNSAVRRRR